MSTNVKMVGYYRRFKNEEEAVEKYRELGFNCNYPTEDFVEDNYYDLFDYKKNESLNKWVPYFDYDNNLGMIYLTEYEYDAFDLIAVFNSDAPVILGEESVPFAVLYYNGSECPLIMK